MTLFQKAAEAMLFAPEQRRPESRDVRPWRRIVSALAVLIVSSAAVPALMHRFLPSFRFPYLVPFAVWLAVSERRIVRSRRLLNRILFLSGGCWIAGAFSELAGGVPPGVGVLGLHVVCLAVFSISNWVPARVPLIFGILCIPATFIDEFTQFLVMSIFGLQTAFFAPAIAGSSLLAAIWGIVAYFVLERLGDASERRCFESRGIL